MELASPSPRWLGHVSGSPGGACQVCSPVCRNSFSSSAASALSGLHCLDPGTGFDQSQRVLERNAQRLLRASAASRRTRIPISNEREKVLRTTVDNFLGEHSFSGNEGPAAPHYAQYAGSGCLGLTAQSLLRPS